MANEQLQSTIESLHERRRKRERMTRIGWIVAGVCALILLACLMVPAFTMEHNKYDCGLEEHTHTDKCYTNEVVCGFPTEKAHVHTPSCYNKKGELTCKKAEAGHIHLAACYDKNDKLTCDKEETVHIHTAACFDKNGKNVCKNKDALHVHGDTCYTEVKSADDKSSSKDSGDEKAAEATTTPVAYKLTCTEESVGHVHRDACYDDKGKLICGKDEVIEIPHKHDDSCYEKVLACGQEEHTHTDECLKEEAPIEVEDEGIDQIDPDANNEAAADGDAAEGDAEGTEAEPSDAAEPDLTEQEIADAEDQGLFYENKDMMIAFTVPDEIKDSIKLKVTETDEEVVPYTEQDLSEFAEASVEAGKAEAEADGEGDNAASSDESSDATANEGEQGTDTQADNADTAQVEAVGSDEKPAYQVNLNIEATLNDQPVEDIASLGITAKVQMKSNVISPILKGINYKEVAPEIKDEIGAEITVLQQPVAPTNATLSELPEAQINEVVATSTKNAAATFSLLSNIATFSVDAPSNVEFTVYYEADFKVPKLSTNSSSANQIGVFDTTKAANGTTKLPSNGNTTPKKKYLTLSSNGEVAMETITESIYESMAAKYFSRPSLKYFNKLAQNNDYKLLSMTVKNASGTKTYSTTSNPDIEKVHFTNNSKSDNLGWNDDKSAYYVLIDAGTEIHLKYEPTTSENNSFYSSFYDYDITDGGVYAKSGNPDKTTNPMQDTEKSSSGTWYGYTNQQGINSDGNYSGKSGTSKLAFGNANTATTLNTVTWENQTLNRYNNKNSAALGATFGMVAGITADGVLQYSSKIDAPNLFNEGSASGKTTYVSKESGKENKLVFKRDGDTYTLSNAIVNGNSAGGNYSSFTQSSKIWSNNYWPMDVAPSYGTNGHDLKFGNSADSVKSRRLLWRNADAGTSHFPVSDDGKDHNSYFGMNFSVDFDLDGQYTGPLQYLFFGDDDMWIFLSKVDSNGKITGTSKLIVDIGGVHSAVGEYVDLWDYLQKGTSSGKYRLSFFYTERGASGSTCYMNFTLPKVTTLETDQKNGSIEISKTVSAAEGSAALTREYEFEIKLFEKDGKTATRDDYAYSLYDKGKMIEENVIYRNGSNFKLKDGQKIVIEYLPEGTQYVVKEILNGDKSFNVSWKCYEDQSFKEEKAGASLGDIPEFRGTVASNKIKYELKYINTVPYELPDTGGIGSHWFWMAGGALITISVGTLVWRRRRGAVSA